MTQSPFDWEENRLSMDSNIKYTDEPIGKVEIVPDFLPTPEELVFRDEDVRGTLAPNKKNA